MFFFIYKIRKHDVVANDTTTHQKQKVEVKRSQFSGTPKASKAPQNIFVEPQLKVVCSSCFFGEI